MFSTKGCLHLRYSCERDELLWLSTRPSARMSPWNSQNGFWCSLLLRIPQKAKLRRLLLNLLSSAMPKLCHKAIQSLQHLRILPSSVINSSMSHRQKWSRRWQPGKQLQWQEEQEQEGEQQQQQQGEEQEQQRKTTTTSTTHNRLHSLQPQPWQLRTICNSQEQNWYSSTKPRSAWCQVSESCSGRLIGLWVYMYNHREWERERERQNKQNILRFSIASIYLFCNLYRICPHISSYYRITSLYTDTRGSVVHLFHFI